MNDQRKESEASTEAGKRTRGTTSAKKDGDESDDENEGKEGERRERACKRAASRKEGTNGVAETGREGKGAAENWGAGGVSNSSIHHEQFVAGGCNYVIGLGRCKGGS